MVIRAGAEPETARAPPPLDGVESGGGGAARARAWQVVDQRGALCDPIGRAGGGAAPGRGGAPGLGIRRQADQLQQAHPRAGVEAGLVEREQRGHEDHSRLARDHPAHLGIVEARLRVGKVRLRFLQLAFGEGGGRLGRVEGLGQGDRARIARGFERQALRVGDTGRGVDGEFQCAHPVVIAAGLSVLRAPFFERSEEVPTHARGNRANGRDLGIGTPWAAPEQPGCAPVVARGPIREQRVEGCEVAHPRTAQCPPEGGDALVVKVRWRREVGRGQPGVLERHRGEVTVIAVLVSRQARDQGRNAPRVCDRIERAGDDLMIGLARVARHLAQVFAQGPDRQPCGKGKHLAAQWGAGRQ